MPPPAGGSSVVGRARGEVGEVLESEVENSQTYVLMGLSCDVGATAAAEEEEEEEEDAIVVFDDTTVVTCRQTHVAVPVCATFT